MVDLTFSGFDWDQGNIQKCNLHGVTLLEIEEVFAGDPLVGPDIHNSGTEERFRVFGRNRAGRAIFLVFTFRDIEGQNIVRPISARYMHAKEVDLYDKLSPRA